MKIDLNSYINLIKDYLSKKISARCFEYVYLMLFQEEKINITEIEHRFLHKIFMDVEALCLNPNLRDKYSIDEEDLRARCKVNLEGLQALNQAKE